ncbi:MAG: hypothetical protein ACUVWJ_01720 [Spirochaetota bacterium]
MKFILKTVLKIILYLILLLIPVTLLLTFLSLKKAGIPTFNIGIRNVVVHSQNYILPSFFISYLISTLIACGLVDKMKIKSLLLLHLPPIIVGCILSVGFYYFRPTEVTFPTERGTVQLGINNYVKRDVFNELDDRLLYIKRKSNELHTLYLYDRVENRLLVFDDINLWKKKGNYLTINPAENMIIVVTKKEKSESLVKIPYRITTLYKSVVNLKLVESYVGRVKGVLSLLRARIDPLNRQDKILMLVSLSISLLMISIPVAYGLNDRGWSFSGLIGVPVVLVILPFIYGFVLKFPDRFPGILQTMGRRSYLFPAAVCCFMGVVLDIIVKAVSKKKG